LPKSGNPGHLPPDYNQDTVTGDGPMKHDQDREKIVNIWNNKTADGCEVESFNNAESLIDEIQRARARVAADLGEKITLEKAQALEGKDDFLNMVIPVKVETLGLLLTILEKAEAAESERRGLRAFFDNFIDAAKAFHANPDGDRWEARAKRFLKTLGITSGSRQVAHNKAALFWEYMNLIFGWDKDHPGTIFDKWEALEVMKERHGMASPDAVLKHLRRYAEGYGKGCFKGVFPGNRQR